MECHMPYRDGTPEGGRVHVMPGGHYIDMVRSAVVLTGARGEDGIARVTLQNTSGHAYPTDERSRASDLWWRMLPAEEGSEPGPWRHLHRIRDPYRHEKDLASTLLHWGEARTLTVEDEKGEVAQGRVEVVLVYKRTPYYRNAETGLAMHLADVEDPFQDSDLVHRVTIEP